MVMFLAGYWLDGVARRAPEPRATRWVGTYRTESVSSPELVSSNLDQALRLPCFRGIARRGFGWLAYGVLSVEGQDLK